MRTCLVGLGVIALTLVAPQMSQGRATMLLAEQKVKLEIEGKGTVEITLYPDRAPQACKRITDLVKQGFYDGQRFHKAVRSPKPFLVQIGDPNSRTKQPSDPSLGNYKSGVRVPFENSGIPHAKGAVGLARLEDDKNSGDSQFYIMLDRYSFLDGQYTVFGQVTSGLQILDKIELGDRVVRVILVN